MSVTENANVIIRAKPDISIPSGGMCVWGGGDDDCENKVCSKYGIPDP
jgi:hypothetical protein